MPAPVVADLPTTLGTERVAFFAAVQARAIVVLLPGGNGVLALDPAGRVHELGANFLVRSTESGRHADPCQADTPHGYAGIESTVVTRIADWIRAAAR